jgi:hypothetical protein
MKGMYRTSGRARCDTKRRSPNKQYLIRTEVMITRVVVLYAIDGGGPDMVIFESQGNACTYVAVKKTIGIELNELNAGVE